MSSPTSRGQGRSLSVRSMLGLAPSDKKEKEEQTTRNTLGVSKYRTDPFPSPPACSSKSSGCTGAGAVGGFRGEVLGSASRGYWAGRDPGSDEV